MSSGGSPGMSMQMAQRLEMIMTPQMIQSMELLQMPLLQLEQKLRQEQVENPVLELTDLEDGPDISPSSDYDADDAPDAPPADAMEASEGLERVDDVDYDWDSMHDEYAPRRLSGDDDEERFDPIANAPSRPPSLLEHLLGQLSEMSIPDRIRRLAAGMVMRLDESGYLVVPLEETVPEEMAPATPEELALALDAVQSLEPAGVGARDLTDCLRLQIDRHPDGTELALDMVENHLEDIAANRLPKIAKDLKTTIAEVQRGVDLIRTLNPRPGMDYSAPEPLVVRPDVIVEGEDDFTVRLASGARPDISDFYTALFDNSRRGKMLRERFEADPVQGPALRQFQEQLRASGLGKRFREKYNSAQWLVKAVAQREKTLLSVAEEVVKAQADYLARRIDAPVPLMMQDIADKVGYDISTVCRAVKDKYADTPLGVIPLRDLFARSAGENEGQALSGAAILARMKEMIDGEDKRKPLKDNEILERLAAEGINLKRRSVVNYREKLGIPSHTQRRAYV